VFLSYSAVGAFATVLHYAVLMASVDLCGFPAPVGAAVGALVGAAASYAANRRLTFASATPHSIAVPRFIAVALLGAALNAAIVWAVLHGIGWHYLVAQAIATVLILSLTFGLNRRWTFP